MLHNNNYHAAWVKIIKFHTKYLFFTMLRYKKKKKQYYKYYTTSASSEVTFISFFFIPAPEIFHTSKVFMSYWWKSIKAFEFCINYNVNPLIRLQIGLSRWKFECRLTELLIEGPIFHAINQSEESPLFFITSWLTYFQSFRFFRECKYIFKNNNQVHSFIYKFFCRNRVN